jgi:hypothetical protein
MSLLSRLQQVPDPRSRHRREYPLPGLLAILILAAAHGETSLRGMWQWGQERASILMNFFPLGLWANARFPALGTFWYLLSKLPAGALEQALGDWGARKEEKGYGVDGKALRGSKRAGEEALRVVTLVGQCLRRVIAQRAVEGGDELAAALQLLESEALEGKVVSADAGLLKAPFAQKVVQKKGAISG